MKLASNPVPVQHRNGARRAEAVRATTGDVAGVSANLEWQTQGTV